MVVAAGKAEDVGCDVLWGASDNERTFYGRDARAKIGWTPRDSVDGFEA